MLKLYYIGVDTPTSYDSFFAGSCSSCLCDRAPTFVDFAYRLEFFMRLVTIWRFYHFRDNLGEFTDFNSVNEFVM